jgi:hypothetical protein
VKPYLDACTIPTVSVGPIQLPKLIMGIHPFDGYGYVDAQRDQAMLDHFADLDRMVEVLSYGAKQGITAAQTDHMVPHLNRRHLVALRETMNQTGIEIATVPFLVVPVTLDGTPLDPRRIHATFDKNAWDRFGQAYRDYLERDPIIGYLADGHGGEDFLVQWEQIPPYSQQEIDRMAIDYGLFDRYIGFFDGFDTLIADPGAEVDLLAPGGRFDLIEEYIGFLRARFQSVVTSVHHPGITIPLLEENDIPFDGYISPVNKPGVFMLPTPEAARSAIRASSRPVIAIKPMAGGRLCTQEAFDHVFGEMGVSACMFGMGTLAEVKETVANAKRALGCA